MLDTGNNLLDSWSTVLEIVGGKLHLHGFPALRSALQCCGSLRSTGPSRKLCSSPCHAARRNKRLCASSTAENSVLYLRPVAGDNGRGASTIELRASCELQTLQAKEKNHGKT